MFKVNNCLIKEVWFFLNTQFGPTLIIFQIKLKQHSPYATHFFSPMIWVTRTLHRSAAAPAPCVTFYNPPWPHQSKSLATPSLTTLIKRWPENSHYNEKLTCLMRSTTIRRKGATEMHVSNQRVAWKLFLQEIYHITERLNMHWLPIRDSHRAITAKT